MKDAKKFEKFEFKVQSSSSRKEVMSSSSEFENGMVKSPLSHSNSKLQLNPNPVNLVNPVKKKNDTPLFSTFLHILYG